MNPPLQGTNWKELEIKSAILLYRHMQERNLVFGTLEAIGVRELEYLTSLSILKPYDVDFYTWANAASQGEWEGLKKMIIKNYFASEAYRVATRDIILTAMTKTKSYVEKSYSSWSDIRAVEITEETRKYYEKVDNFEKVILNQE